MTDVLVAGETLIDFLPGSAGRLAEVETFSRRAGGAPANVAVGLARLDADPLFWTRLGADPFGDFLADTLADYGVPTDLVTRDTEAKTGLAFVSHDADAERAFSFYRDGSADTRLEPGRIGDETLADHDWVHVGGVTLADDPARTATLDLAERARRADCTVSFDPNARPELWDTFDFADSCRTAFGLADVVKATPEDLRAAGFEGEPADLARAVCEHGPHTALITVGGEGAYAHATADAPWTGAETPEDSAETPAGIEVSHAGYAVDVVDTTGAGDAFTAGAIAALSDGAALADALAFANAVAAVTTTGTGAMTALPTREAVQSFLGS
ncbi:carbohydrate kinase family protein [Salinirubrum litoreum]|uniref:Carbohydrate kinase family protein n=1 Tax=Salinirubrum litoreum TaxID=1126234 RepID=A0ABD5RAE2_9EURY|nr:carbohydrate kinase [Salinirubrum litoreum]